MVGGCFLHGSEQATLGGKEARNLWAGSGGALNHGGDALGGREEITSEE
jgi:hypothetical protein